MNNIALRMMRILLLCLLPTAAMTQITETACWNSPPGSPQSVDNTGLIGASLPQVFFGTGQFPAGTQIVDVSLDVHWSQTNGACGTLTGPTDYQQVGFRLEAPSGTTVDLALPGDWGGTAQIGNVTTSFASGGAALNGGLPANTIYEPAGAGGMSNFYGQTAVGGWSVIVIDNAAGTPVCVDSFCLTVTACNPSSLTAVCQTTYTLALDNTTGAGVLTFADLDDGSNITCGLANVNITPNNFDCSDANTTTTVTMELTDNLGNTASCNSSVTIQDTTPPVVACQDITVALDAAGNFTLNVADSLGPISSDNCNIVSYQAEVVGLTTPSTVLNLDCNFVGSSPTNFIVTDASGNQTVCPSSSFNLTVLDTFPPTMICQNRTVYLDNNCEVVVDANDIDNGSSDVCTPITSLTLNGGAAVTYTAAAIGTPQVVNLAGSDAYGNIDSCSATVTVLDTIRPNPVCVPFTAVLSPAGSVTVNPGDIDGGSSDNCSAVSLLINGQPSITFGCGDIGPNLVTLIVEDAYGNIDSCQTTVTVEDNTDPTADCQPTFTATLSGSSVTFPASALNLNSNDVCAGTNLTYTVGGQPNVTFGCAAVGTQSVTLEVTDPSGNTSTCVSTVTVQDTTAPIANCQANINAFLSGGTATVNATDLNLNSSDNCTSLTFEINGQPQQNFSCADVGPAFPVTLTVIDGAGNTDTCVTNVTVQDTLAPVVACQNITESLSASAGTVTVTATDIVDFAGTSDNCGSGSLQYFINGNNSVQYTCDSVGVRTAILTVQDAQGNQASCPAQVTIEDNTDPTLVCQAFTATLSGASVTVLPQSAVNLTATSDNCGIAGYTINGNASQVFDCSAVGTPQPVVIEATDANGNTTDCTVNITVQDNTAPTANCIGVNAVLDPVTGLATVTAADVDGGSTDNCSIVSRTINGQPSIDFDCSQIGLNNVTLEVTDPSGLTNTCVASVSVQDNTPPTVNCTPFTAFLDPSGSVTVNPSDIGTGSDNCSPLTSFINNQPSFTYTCAQLGSNTATLRVEDPSGQTASCPANVTVVDTVSPDAQCFSSLDVYLDASTGFANVDAVDVDSASTDNCTISSFTINGSSNQVYTCADLGTVNVTLTVTDQDNNTDVCSVVLNIIDSVAPSMACQNATVNLGATGTPGEIAVAATSLDNGTSDNCGPLTFSINGQSDTTFLCSDVGVNQVVLTATDGSGNSNTCTVDVTVNDVTNPTIVTVNDTVYLNAAGTASIVPGDVDGGSTDDCAPLSLTVTPNTFNCSNVGNNSVSLAGTDPSGNNSSAPAIVTVLDTLPPTAVCVNDTVILDVNGTALLNVSSIDGGSFDNCGTVTSTVNGSSTVAFTCADVGVNTLTMTVTDANGVTATCTADVTVQDTTAPEAICVSNFNAFLSGSNVTVPAASLDSASTDNCSSSLNFLVNGQPTVTYNCNAVGNNQNVILTVFDTAGNSDTCSSTITVIDSVAPVAQCATSVPPINLNSNGQAFVNALTLNSGSSDNCSGLTYLINGVPTDTFTCADLGTVPATLTVQDNSGNTDDCTVNLTINDNLPPSPSCVSITVFITAGGTVQVFPNQIDGGSTDNCGIVTYLINGKPFEEYSCTDLGNNLAQLTVIDAAGLSASCQAIVTVRDTISPVAQCPTTPVVVQLSALNGTVQVPAAAVDGGSTDNCSISNILINGSTNQVYNCSDIGLNNVTLTVIDNASPANSATCQAVIEVQDTVTPTIICQPLTVTLNATTGQATVVPSQIDGGSFDNCNIVSYLINGQSSVTYNCSNVGTNNVVFEIEDASGNIATCQTTVTVNDNTNPSISCSPHTAYLTTGGTVSVVPQDVATASDVCGTLTFTINGQPNVLFDCSDVGSPQVVTVQVTDASNNVNSCTGIVTVLDTISPDAQCQNITVDIGANGQVQVFANQVNQGSSDNCAISNFTINGQSQLTFTCADIGVQTVNFEVTDPSGNVGICQADITVQDNVDPDAICVSPFTIPLNSNGTVTIQATDIDSASTDNCNIVSRTINGATSLQFDCSNVGTNTITLEVTDPSGGTDFCQTTVTVQDITPPTMVCQPATVYLGASGTTTVNATVIDGGSSDACGILNYRINGQPTETYDCNQIGAPQAATLIVTDINGNVDSCSTTVTVLDTVAPTAICANLPPINLSLTGDTVLTPFDIDNGSTDNCFLFSRSITPDTIDCTAAAQGIVTVTLTVADASGNTDFCTTDIQVNLAGASPTSNSPVCEGDNINLFANPPATAGGGFTYQWTGPNGYTSTQQNPVIPDASAQDTGFYVVTITPVGGGCPASDTVAVDVNIVVPPAVVANTPLCEGDEAVLEVANTADYAGGTVINYDWIYNGASLGVNNDSLIINSLSLADTGAYSVAVEVDGCTDTTIIPYTLVVNELPSAPQAFASNVPCEGDTLFLVSNPQDTIPFNYTWVGPNGFSSSDSTPIITNVSTLAGGDYFLTITDVNTCASSDTISVTIRPRPDTPSLVTNIPICAGDELELRDTTNYPLAPNLVWTLADGTVNTTPAPVAQLVVFDPIEGVYSVQAEINGCLSVLDTQSVVFEPVPEAIDDQFDTEFRVPIIGFDVTSNDATTGFTITVLDSTQGGELRNIGNGTFDYTPQRNFFGTDTFTYVICDDLCPNSCDTATVSLFVDTEFECLISEGISPNGDGINDFFEVRCLNEYPNKNVRIFNRWGNLVYDGSGDDFNGQFNGNDLPDGTYFYFVKLNDTSNVENDEYTGFFMIHR